MKVSSSKVVDGGKNNTQQLRGKLINTSKLLENFLISFNNDFVHVKKFLHLPHPTNCHQAGWAKHTKHNILSFMSSNLMLGNEKIDIMEQLSN